jgi:hypothetical protein
MPRPSPWDLDFAASRNAAQKHLGHKMEILRPLILFSHGLLREIPALCRDEIDLVVALSFRQCLEFADGVDLLLRHLMIVPAAAQARSALEHAPQVILLARRRDPVLAAAYLLSGMRNFEHELERKLKAPVFDEEDRNAIRLELDGVREHMSKYSADRAGREAFDGLRKLGPGRPWYAVRSGPENFHRLVEELELGAVSNFYSDLNPVVHGGMPVLAAASASGDPADENNQEEWLRPLRAPSPWSFRPILATSTALYLALVAVIPHFVSLAPEWVVRLETFRKEHERRCRKAEMPSLVL